MPESRTETARTVHGDVSYDVVECDSCDNAVPKAEAYKFLIAGRVHERSYSHDKVYDTESTGWACPYCLDNGPVSFPERAVNKTWSLLATLSVGVGIGSLLTWLVVILLA